MTVGRNEGLRVANVVILSPGSLFTSTIPALLGAGVREALASATPVEVDREEVERLGVRLREADLFSDEVGTSIRHDANRLAKEVCKIALVRL
jgi:2-phospho-L-lactate transferase/gluconeogenesis factor (CofD/UPF0052 family)